MVSPAPGGEKDDPFESAINIEGTTDHFQTGIYTSDISDGRGKSWSAGFNVSYDAGISIAPPDDPDTPIWLEAGSSAGQTINILDRVYGNPLEKRYRGVFWNSGSLKLNNFITRVEEGGLEIGSVTAHIPMNCAYTFWDAVPIFQDVYYAGAIPLSVEYVRGHRIPDPVSSLSVNNNAVITGQQTTITVRVFNPSSVVGIEGGSVNLDIGSLNSNLVVIGSSALPVDTIPAGQFHDYTFTVQGTSIGTSTPQVTVSGLWGYPVADAEKTFTVSGSLDKNIEVVPVPSITVTSPDGGESLQAGSNISITWASVGNSGNVQILYSVDAGSNWTTLIAEKPDDGTYLWVLPDLNSFSCLVMVADADGNPADQSNSVFTISKVPVITIFSPNGGEIWHTGSTQNIRWTSLGTSRNVQIQYSPDNGSNWTEIAYSTPDDGSYSWIIPDLFSAECLVRVIDTDGNPADQSNTVFSISPIPEIDVVSPNGGESLQAGSSHNITWTSSVTSGNVQILFSVNNGSDWIEVIRSTPDDGSFIWTVPNSPSAACLVRISDADGSPADQSNSVFTVAAIPMIRVTTPDRGETWRVGINQDITWTSTGTSGNVQILFSSDNGSSWTEIIDSTPDDGSYTWTIPDSPSSACLVMVTDTDGSPANQSNSAFIITTICDQVTIRSQPSNSSICAIYGNTTFSVRVNGSPPFVYQWQINNGGAWINAVKGIPSGAMYLQPTSPTLEVSGLISAGEYQYRCLITNCSAGSVTSNEVTLTVRPSPTDIVAGVISQPTCTIPAGSVVLSGLPAAGTWTLTQMPGSNVITGIGTSAAIPDLQPGTYSFTVTNASGCTSGISEDIFIETPDPGVIPRITIKYNDVLICYNLGDSLLSYQWYDGINPIPDASHQYYQTLKKPGIYSVIAVDINGCMNSSNSITVSGPKSLTAYPNPASVSFALRMDDNNGGAAVIRILNSTGVRIMELELEDFNNELLNEIPVKDLKEGMYFVQVLVNNKEIYYTKIVIAK